MAFVKEIKNKAYFKRFQVKLKRRRKGKTDYRQRKGLIIQDKNKYATPKYRLVVRFSNKNITCQVVYATLTHDVVMAAAYSKELPSYGLNFGLTNYAAAYCTGLLLARRVLSKLGLAEAYKGLQEASGEDYLVEENDDGPRPFFCLLDVGLKRTSTGSKVFAALKGALDGGLDIPHSDKRYVGYDPESKSLDEDTLRKYIFGGHVAEYMESMKEEDPEAYAKHFSCFIKEGIEVRRFGGNLQEGSRRHPRQPEAYKGLQEASGEDLRAEEVRPCREDCFHQGGVSTWSRSSPGSFPCMERANECPRIFDKSQV